MCIRCLSVLSAFPPPPHHNTVLVSVYPDLHKQAYHAKAYCKQEAHHTNEVLNELEKLILTLKFLPFCNLPKRNFSYQRLFKGLKITMILLCKALSSCWTVSWEQVLLLLFSSLPAPKGRNQQGIRWCKCFLKDTTRWSHLEQQPTRKELACTICCTCWKLI